MTRARPDYFFGRSGVLECRSCFVDAKGGRGGRGSCRAACTFGSAEAWPSQSACRKSFIFSKPSEKCGQLQAGPGVKTAHTASAAASGVAGMSQESSPSENAANTDSE